MEAINFHVNEYKKYGVRIARYISLFNDPEDNPTSVHYDFSQLQYVRSDDLDSFTEICKQLFEEFQIIEFKDPKDTWAENVVYTTPLLSEILEIDKTLKDKRGKETDELKIKNREWLATVPKSQVLYKFSTGADLVLVYDIYSTNNTRYGKEAVNANIYFHKSDKSPDYKDRLFLAYYISRNGRVLKKKFCKDYMNLGYPLDELEFVASKLLEYRNNLYKLNNLLI